MPANLPPEYFEAEKRYREAQSPEEKISALEALIATVPKHKGTDKLRGDLRRKLSKLREAAQKKKKAGRTDLYSVERQGAAQVTLMGLPNSGKSSLLATMTNAKPVIADYPMSTVLPVTGMMPFEDIQFQIVDLPPVGNESTDGWVSAIIRNSDLITLVVDATEDPEVQAELLFEQITKWRIPLKTEHPNSSTSPGVKPKNVIIVINKIDIFPDNRNFALNGYEKYPVVLFSAKEGRGVEDLRNLIFRYSGIIRVYTKEPGKKPDLSTPFTISKGSTVLDLAGLIHKDFVENMKYACIWGSAKFDGQRVNKDYILHDRDIVEYHLR